MTISTHKKYWTDDELLALPDDANKYEVLDGELIVSPAASPIHGSIIMRILVPLANHVIAHDLGEVVEGQSGFRMLNADCLSPDISFIRADRWTGYIQAKPVFFEGAPDLLVEVLSPSDRPGLLNRRLSRFFENGARLAWLVDPRKRSAQVYHSPQPGKTLSLADALDGEDVVPGFTLPLSQVFR